MISPSPNPTLNHEVERLSQLVTSRRDAYITHARDSGFGVRFGEATCFDHTTKEIVIGVRSLYESGIRTISGFDFASLHEIKHYLDMRSDPRAFHKFIAKGERADGLGKLYFNLYNCTEDIAVNERVRHDSAIFRDDESGYSQLVSDLYREALFKERDFTSRLLCQQFSDYILNAGMRVTDDIIVSPEVREVLDRKIDIFGKKYSIEDFIDQFLRPAPFGEKPRAGNSVQKRVNYVEQYIEPIFEALLEIDKNKNPEKLEEQPQQEQDVPRGSTIDDLKRALETITNENIEAAKTPAQRAKEHLKKLQIDEAGKAGLNPEQAEDFAERLSRLQPIIQLLSDYWLSIPQISNEVTSVYEGHFQNGIRPDIRRLVAHLPELLEGQTDIEVMERYVEVETPSLSPSHLRVRLVVDSSGSMNSHMSTVADLSLALGASFVAANSTAQIRGLDFTCESQCITFDIGKTEIFPVKSDATLGDWMVAYGKFFNYGGDTNDHLALGHINDGLTTEDDEPRVNGELFDLVIEITDGNTSDPAATCYEISKLESRNVIPRAIIIGDGSTFDEIWNSNGANRGVRIEGVDQLVDTVIGILQNEIYLLQQRMSGSPTSPVTNSRAAPLFGS